jgi:hypothetical protein
MIIIYNDSIAESARASLKAVRRRREEGRAVYDRA